MKAWLPFSHTAPATIDEPVPALVDSIVGHPSLNKRPILIANDLEEEFVRRGWPTGMNFGGEAALASHYSIGRDVVREVVRVLEGRNHAKMRRGARGGLEVVLPELDGLVGRLAGYAYVSSLDDRQIIETWLILQRVSIKMIRLDDDFNWPALIVRLSALGTDAESIGSTVIEASNSPILTILGKLLAALLPSTNLPELKDAHALLVGAGNSTDLLTWLDSCQASAAAARLGNRAADLPVCRISTNFDSPAMRLVHCLMSEIVPQDWVRGNLIGNEFDLADRFGADKSVVRQAIRLMEDAEAARAMPGRGHGLVTQMPSTAPLSRLLSAFLVAHQSNVDEGDRLFAALRVESAGSAAAHATIEDNAMLLAMCHDLDMLAAPCPVSALQGFERVQQRATHNRLLGMIIDGIKAFLTWRAASWPVASAPIIGVYRTHTKMVIHAICSGDRAAAMEAEAEKFRALHEARSQ